MTADANFGAKESRRGSRSTPSVPPPDDEALQHHPATLAKGAAQRIEDVARGGAGKPKQSSELASAPRVHHRPRRRRADQEDRSDRDGRASSTRSNAMSVLNTTITRQHREAARGRVVSKVVLSGNPHRLDRGGGLHADGQGRRGGAPGRQADPSAASPTEIGTARNRWSDVTAAESGLDRDDYKGRLSTLDRGCIAALRKAKLVDGARWRPAVGGAADAHAQGPLLRRTARTVFGTPLSARKPTIATCSAIPARTGRRRSLRRSGDVLRGDTPPLKVQRHPFRSKAARHDQGPHAGTPRSISRWRSRPCR